MNVYFVICLFVTNTAHYYVVPVTLLSRDPGVGAEVLGSRN
ncbi:hypothetical protein GCM10011607_39440 [Shewanella inventionis]|uniref:Uncharacterized protein n=1 Tax=Shewanella inventionis TaxID=1738770 RepID=A0ABQ1JSE1_9GAMM|nr:hypothetical protein GCM10011607_39440 [Shewanella inventionis]